MRVFAALFATIGFASGCGSDGGGAGPDLAVADLTAGPDLSFDTQLCRPTFLNAPAPTGRGGSVTLYITEGGTTNGNVSFTTIELDAGAGQEQCTHVTSGSCEVISCTATDMPLTSFNESVGTIQVTGGAYPVTFAPAADKSYPQLLDDALWSGGETLRFVAPGADQSRFDAMVLAPAPVTTTQPAVPGSPPLVVPRSQDLNVTWTAAASASFVEISIFAADASNNSSSALVCEFAADVGAGTVPSSLLRMLPAGSADFTVYDACAQWVNTPSAPVFLQLGIEGPGVVHAQAGNLTLQ